MPATSTQPRAEIRSAPYTIRTASGALVRPCGAHGFELLEGAETAPEIARAPAGRTFSVASMRSILGIR